MMGELTNEQIDQILNNQSVGRLGCYAKGELYMVPVNYAYDGKFIYAHSKEGMKIHMMRENKEVCFEVDVMENKDNWRSVIVWGTYEELDDEAARNQAMKILGNKMKPVQTSETATPYRQTMAPYVIEKERKNIAYRIRVKRKTGRFEKITF